MIFAIDSGKTAKGAIVAAAGGARMRAGCARSRERNANRINAMRCRPVLRLMRDGQPTVRERRLLRAACDIDMRKTSLDRPEPDGYMPSLFSTD
ncbi:hypothetical protein A8D61_31580 [Burkholderia cenocepacia]|nr:hypothetical protein A8D61_31580 [Burkholderia cenocepacia]ONJ17035.1 hypothetical protein A8D82_26940 [Burkholderia cenocepacia]ONN79865.1 hypothetical protein A8D62_34365 [Burkholderia cenocepacia]ONN80659.1 hypothetical protein A8D64_28640 [Burkholderia cenocepacia]ONN83514.1 hypothetical protein A8D64_24070 [Burkholderia cenocepacia]